MSRIHFERALYHLGHNAPLVQDHDTIEEALDALIEETRQIAERDPTAAIPPFELTDAEREVICNADIVQIYRWDIHPNLIKNFTGVWGVDYVQVYREAGL